MLRYLIALCVFLTSCKQDDSSSNHPIVDPNPKFRDSFVGATKLEFVSQTFPESERESVTIDDTSEVEAFISSFEFDNFPEGEITHCMCGGDPHVKVTIEGGKTQEFKLHHGRSIRWEAFGSDLMLTHESMSKLGDFLKRHGIESK